MLWLLAASRALARDREPTAQARRLDARSVKELMASTRPAFVLLLPGVCKVGNVCDEMAHFWDLIESHMPGIAWRCDCELVRGSLNICEAYGVVDAHGMPEVVQWVGGAWKPYTGPRKIDGILDVVRHAYEQRPPQTSAELPELAAFEAIIEQTDLSSSEAILRVATPRMDSATPEVKERAVDLLERAFTDAVDEPLTGRTVVGRAVAYQVFIHRWVAHDYTRARVALLEALSGGGGDDCWQMQLATMVDKYPASEAESDVVMRRYRDEMSRLLALERDLELRPEHTYNFCLFPLFDHSFHYGADLRLNAALFARLALKAFPELRRADVPPPPRRVCGGRVRLGVASGCFGSLSHPVPSDFGGVLDRLPRDVFEIVFIHFDDLDGGSEWLTRRDVEYVHLTKHDDGWLPTARRRIAALQLDLLLYLDLTMSEMAHQAAMARLAPVQAVSHGHPVTSGVPSDVMDHYVSWAAAELPTAHEHYTEGLALLPAHTMHQYYESRISAVDGASTVDGGTFREIGRDAFDVPAARRWYLCMQKPFKFSPAFDEMLAAVHAGDPDGLIVLHEVQFKGSGATSAHNKRRFVQRLRRAGVDLERLHFLKQQPHHRLMALYSLADVVLDSYYAGGCTTTREALEVGALVVTLPAKYLGSRWSLAYYTIMGVTDLVARDKRHYAQLAVQMATDTAAASATRRRILDNVHKLFHQQAAVDAWSTLLQRLAAPAVGNCTAKEEGSDVRTDLSKEEL